jgi:raffinose/stachyose/melibiose transport system permease protein
MRNASGGRLGVVVRHAFLLIIALAALYPLYFIVATAIKTNADYQLDPTGFPSHPSLSALRAIVEDQPLPRWLWNSFLVTLVSVAASTVIALFAAYAIVFGRFRGHQIFLSTSVALMVVPPVTLLVPMFVFMVDRGWINHLQSVMIFYSGLLVPFAIFFLVNFFRTVPHELIEAASVEGAGPFTVLRQVVLPLAGAATFTLVVVQAIWAWNELLIARVPADGRGAHAQRRAGAVPGPLLDEPAADPRGCADLDRSRRAAVPVGAALLRARADGGDRQVAVHPTRGTTRSLNTWSCARSSASGQRKTRCAPARTYASSVSAQCSAEPMGRTARSCSTGRLSIGARTSASMASARARFSVT